MYTVTKTLLALAVLVCVSAASHVSDGQEDSPRFLFGGGYGRNYGSYSNGYGRYNGGYGGSGLQYGNGGYGGIGLQYGNGGYGGLGRYGGGYGLSGGYGGYGSYGGLGSLARLGGLGGYGGYGGNSVYGLNRPYRIGYQLRGGDIKEAVEGDNNQLAEPEKGSISLKPRFDLLGFFNLQSNTSG
ncbi:hypothetical protein YQE_10357, partial [Dendroctonus ponderosae]